MPSDRLLSIICFYSLPLHPYDGDQSFHFCPSKVTTSNIHTLFKNCVANASLPLIIAFFEFFLLPLLPPLLRTIVVIVVGMFILSCFLLLVSSTHMLLLAQDRGKGDWIAELFIYLPISLLLWPTGCCIY